MRVAKSPTARVVWIEEPSTIRKTGPVTASSNYAQKARNAQRPVTTWLGRQRSTLSPYADPMVPGFAGSS
ncbi:hypothetical protein GCM10027187_39930 [Streptosporangium sandarakinum]